VHYKYSDGNLAGTLCGTLVATSVVRLAITIELKLLEIDKMDGYIFEVR
jgi:hypothetical protein